jgi:hypothetical protein
MLLPSKRLPAALSAAVARALVVSAATLISACAVQTRVYAPAPVVTAEVAVPGAAVAVTAQEPPPPLPDYEQPPAPADGYLWTPGYWGYAGGGYYWVPGTWVQPPTVGVLWTPGYWGFAGGVYGFHPGYWGPHIGFYGGVNYGFGYGGTGFAGGRWEGGHFAYNTAVSNVNVTVIHNTYNQTVINNNVTVNRTSFNGGAGGVMAAPTPQQRAAASEPHTPPTPVQTAHVQAASQNPALSARANGGHPAIAATPRPGAFSGPGIVGARGVTPPPPRPLGANELSHQPNAPEAARPAPPAEPPRPAPEPAARPAPAAEFARPVPAAPAVTKPPVSKPRAARPAMPSKPPKPAAKPKPAPKPKPEERKDN